MAASSKPHLRLHLDGRITPAQRHGTAPVLNGAAICDRMQIAYGVTGFAALADAMRKPSNSVKNWSYRNSIRLQHVIQCALDTGRSLDWIVLNREPGAH